MACSLSWHSRASESMPFLPSTGSIATRDVHLRRDLNHAAGVSTFLA